MATDGLTGRPWRRACLGVFFGALLVLVPTLGDPGLTWDEPAYRYSQLLSVQWWGRLAHARSADELRDLFDPLTLAYYWPYARHGINFHPPLAGQLNLLTYELTGGFLKDYPARRLSSAVEFALTVTLLFGFLARRYGTWVGGVAAGSLYLMPRLFGDAHIAGTDTPGLLLWATTSLAFWKGLHEPVARRWRVAVGVLLGLAFVEKMGAVMVLLPILGWLVLARLPRARRADWTDGLATTGAMMLPLGVALAEVLRLTKQLPPPQYYNPYQFRPATPIPGAILLGPLAVWIGRRLLGRLRPKSAVWGAERPALETWTAILAFAPPVAWLCNPAWWRETLPRLAHYYMLNFGRRGSLPDIQILYLGQTYEYSLPWHNGWVLLAITVPAGILIAGTFGLIYALVRIPRDRLPLYFAIQMAMLPALRMLPTPAHDGVRLFLPTFFFLAGLAGWGVDWLGGGLAHVLGLARRSAWFKTVLAAAVLGPAAWQLWQVHPFELSYYNEIIGGPRGAWGAGFELAYWYDALDARTLDELNRRLPRDATVEFANELSAPTMVIEDLQSLGHLRAGLGPAAPRRDRLPYMWLLTHDSKASAFSRLLYAMSPWYARAPRQLDELRVFTVADPVAVSRARALWLLTDAPDRSRPDPPAAPQWVRDFAPPLARFWGDTITRIKKLTLNEPIFDWARTDPDGLRAAARAVVAGRADSDPEARRLLAILSRYERPEEGKFPAESLLRARPRALVEAVEILIDRPEAVRKVLTRYGYTSPEATGGPLDLGLSQP